MDAIRVVPTGEAQGSFQKKFKRPDPCVIVIFGASGDLTRRKLIPSLFQLFVDGMLPECFRIVGFARSELAPESFRGKLKQSLVEFARVKPISEKLWDQFAEMIEYHQGEYGGLDGYRSLKDKLDAIQAKCGLGANRLFYIATPPSQYSEIISNLKDGGLIYNGAYTEWSRVIIEKPFGHDLDSARKLNAVVTGALAENQVYRIDHYLGKETVQNILVFRFANTIFEPIWNRNHIDHVQITAAENIDVSGRGSFYDEAGVVRDFFQNHLFEIMSLVAMEQPVSFQADPIRDEKVKILRSLRPMFGDDLKNNVILAQYDGYRDVEGVKPGSRTPTYAAMKVMIDNWRWQGVPFFLRAGKALSSRVTEVSIHFKRIPFCLFGHDEVCQQLSPNVLNIRIQPDEGIRLKFGCKQPGEGMAVRDVIMDFSYSEAFEASTPDAYERLLVDAMKGEQTLFSRSDAVEHAWAYITPVIKGYEEDESLTIHSYDKGTDGPDAAAKLVFASGSRWEPLG
ncbi:MAG: glucose-6-phosphate dehydrogenase [Planctomycetes bacterium]|nr:glucose-6-phosphate dehydrogenase [Planctomycetota bacterium]